MIPKAPVPLIGDPCRTWMNRGSLSRTTNWSGVSGPSTAPSRPAGSVGLRDTDTSNGVEPVVSTAYVVPGSA